MNIVGETEVEAPLDLVGGKARGLVKLKSLEEKLNQITFNHRETRIIVPSFFIVPFDLNLKEDYKKILEQAKRLNVEAYAVRSSSALEDIGEHSFDGIFDTKLDVPIERIVREIHMIRKSANSEKATAYAREVGIELNRIMPVIIQAMAVPNPKAKKNYSKETGIVYSKFPCPRDIIKVIREDVHERNIIAFLREHDKNKIPVGDPIIISRYGKYYTEESEDLATIAMEIENEFGYPVILEYTTFSDSYGNKEMSLLQARKLTKLSEAERFQMPELQEKGLIATTYDLNGIGDFTGEAFYVPGPGFSGRVDIDGLEEFDLEHKDKGYIFVTPYLKFYNCNLDQFSQNKKAVIVYRELGKRHDYEIARKKGLLYLNCKDCLHMGFYSAREDNKKAPIETGEKVRVVSDGEKGFVFNLSR